MSTPPPEYDKIVASREPINIKYEYSWHPEGVYVRFDEGAGPGDPETLQLGPFPSAVDPTSWPPWWVSPNGNYCFKYNDRIVGFRRLTIILPQQQLSRK